MKILYRLIAAVVFIFFFVFALKNTHEAILLLFLDYQVRAPLVLILLGFFIVGAALGILALMPTLVRNRREVARQKKLVTTIRQEHEAVLARQARPPQPDIVLTEQPRLTSSTDF